MEWLPVWSQQLSYLCNTLPLSKAVSQTYRLLTTHSAHRRDRQTYFSRNKGIKTFIYTSKSIEGYCKNTKKNPPTFFIRGRLPPRVQQNPEHRMPPRVPEYLLEPLAPRHQLRLPWRGARILAAPRTILTLLDEIIDGLVKTFVFFFTFWWLPFSLLKN